MFNHHQEKDVDIITVYEARLDASNSPQFLELIDCVLKEGSRSIIVDLSSVRYMDSSALGATVSTLKKLGEGGSLILVGISGLVEDLFTLTRMDKVFNLAATIDEAKIQLAA